MNPFFGSLLQFWRSLDVWLWVAVSFVVGGTGVLASNVTVQLSVFVFSLGAAILISWRRKRASGWNWPGLRPRDTLGIIYVVAVSGFGLAWLSATNTRMLGLDDTPTLGDGLRYLVEPRVLRNVLFFVPMFCLAIASSLKLTDIQNFGAASKQSKRT